MQVFRRSPAMLLRSNCRHSDLLTTDLRPDSARIIVGAPRGAATSEGQPHPKEATGGHWRELVAFFACASARCRFFLYRIADIVKSNTSWVSSCDRRKRSSGGTCASTYSELWNLRSASGCGLEGRNKLFHETPSTTRTHLDKR